MRKNKQIFEVDAATASPGGVLPEVERKAGAFACFAFRNQALEAGLGTEAVAQQVFRGSVDRIGFSFISSKSADQIEHGRYVERRSGAVENIDFKFVSGDLSYEP